MPTDLNVFSISYSKLFLPEILISSLISDHIFSSRVSGTLLIWLFLQYLKFSPGSAWTNKGFKSKSSKFEAPLFTWDNKSERPII